MKVIFTPSIPPNRALLTPVDKTWIGQQKQLHNFWSIDFYVKNEKTNNGEANNGW
ncbi:hypothetical protein [Nostoc sp. ChiVER01]|uniref:hypothetical protein n=1 Tax=Nostoc sp. ChiVER01 TaxID=3075382 RepID=UPI002AD37C15|nr:hypothetical protein [Nostoc sp. ChiVER01]MDZ8221469.1 hypothetical protein [Nostoc sp. ChiVER01]